MQKPEDKIFFEFDVKNLDEKVLDFLTFLEVSAKSEATGEQAFDLSEQIKENWWKKNKKKFLNENNNR